MAPQRDNMLEAFRKMSREGEASGEAAPAEPARGARSRRERSVPKEARAPRPPRPERAGRSLGELAGAIGSGGPRGLPLVLGGALLLGLAFGAGVLVGRGGEPAPATAEDTAQGDWTEDWRVATPDELAPAGLVARGERGVPTEAAAPAITELPVPDSALYDPANEYTIVVVTYGSSPEGERLAFAARDHLELEGLPVEEPYQVGDHIVVFVGAAPRSEDLADLEARVRSLTRDGRSRVYGDAFRVRIDRYVSR